jgi:hypothetical protein
MKNQIPSLPARKTLIAALLAGLALNVQADVITDWNGKTNELIVEAKLGTPPAIRVMAIVQTAAYEAVKSVGTASLKKSADGPSADAAVAAAHRAALVKLLPAQQASVDAAYQAALAQIADGPSKVAGIAAGEKAAATVLAQRSTDAVGAEAYRPYTTAGTYVTKWGSNGTGNGQFNSPYAIAVDPSGNVYVTEYNGARIQKFTAAGTYITKWGTAGTGNGQFNSPSGIGVDPTGTYVYVVDEFNYRVQKFDASGNYASQWGGYGSGNGQFKTPIGGTVDASGYVYVTDAALKSIRRFSASSRFCSRNWFVALTKKPAMSCRAPSLLAQVQMPRPAPAQATLSSTTNAKAITDPSGDQAGSMTYPSP